MRGYLFALTLLLWILVGSVWVLPRKFRLMRRLGHLTPQEIMKRGEEGDAEAKILHRDSNRFMIAGLILLPPQTFLRYM